MNTHTQRPFFQKWYDQNVSKVEVLIQTVEKPSLFVHLLWWLHSFHTECTCAEVWRRWAETLVVNVVNEPFEELVLLKLAAVHTLLTTRDKTCHFLLTVLLLLWRPNVEKLSLYRLEFLFMALKDMYVTIILLLLTFTNTSLKSKVNRHDLTWTAFFLLAYND